MRSRRLGAGLDEKNSMLRLVSKGRPAALSRALSSLKFVTHSELNDILEARDEEGKKEHNKALKNELTEAVRKEVKEAFKNELTEVLRKEVKEPLKNELTESLKTVITEKMDEMEERFDAKLDAGEYRLETSFKGLISEKMENTEVRFAKIERYLKGLDKKVDQIGAGLGRSFEVYNKEWLEHHLTELGFKDAQVVINIKELDSTFQGR